MKRTVAGEAIQALEVIQEEPEFLTQCQAALAAVNRGSGESLRALIDLGRIGQEIMADPSRWGPIPTKRRSASAIDLVAKFLGAHRPTFRMAMRIVETFSHETLESFLTRHSSTGHLITLAHVRVLLRAESAIQRAELLEYYFRYSSKPQQLGAVARKLRGPRGDCTASPPPKNLNGAAMRLSTLARTMTDNLDGHLRGFLFQPMCEWADGKGSPGPAELQMVIKLHAEAVALQSSLDWAVEILGRTKEALEGPPRRVTSKPVRNMSGAIKRLTALMRTVESEIEGELERALFQHLRDFIAGTGELQPDALKTLKKLGDQMASHLTVMSTATEIVIAAEEALAARQGTAG
jgi:hypothetical protein